MASRAWYAQRRAKGLCVTCPLPSLTFAHCSCCRLLSAERNRRYRRTYYLRHRTEINARNRASKRWRAYERKAA